MERTATEILNQHRKLESKCRWLIGLSLWTSNSRLSWLKQKLNSKMSSFA